MRALLLAALLSGCGGTQECQLAGAGRWNGAGSPVGNYSSTPIYFPFATAGTVKYEFGSAETTLSFDYTKGILTLSDDSFCHASGIDDPGAYKVDFHGCKEFGLMVANDPCKMRQSVFNGTILVRP